MSVLGDMSEVCRGALFEDLFKRSQPEEEHRVPCVHFPSSFVLFLCFIVLLMQLFVCGVFFCFFSAAGCMLPTISAASGCALDKHSHCSALEHTGRIPQDVLYSILWRIRPFMGPHESSVAHRRATVDTFAVN